MGNGINLDYSISARRGSYGISGIYSKSLGDVSSEEDKCVELLTRPWQHNGLTVPKEWRAAVDFLAKIMGYRVTLVEPCFGKNRADTIQLNRYNSTTVNQQLCNLGSRLKEDDILKNVRYIVDYCNLKNATIESLPTLSVVSGNLTVDASSPLKSLPSLQWVGGKLFVVAKNKEEMEEYIRQLGIPSGYDRTHVLSHGAELIMKNYV